MESTFVDDLGADSGYFSDHHGELKKPLISKLIMMKREKIVTVGDAVEQIKMQLMTRHRRK